eukprot:TRINITY_DN26934_c0_g1_i2.p1 TRINITY_DN26934_c0_g1~~TRINITY_DN26934_c0_g1_i2.p1  ORF type:complete len:323 (-),score=24.73 TRINITY_DN26934_c0_g1_i2:84-1052(-)
MAGCLHQRWQHPLLACTLIVSHFRQTASKLYWSSNFPHAIRAMERDGSSPHDIVTGLSFPHGLAVDMEHGRIFWSEHYEEIDKILCSNIDGSDVQDVLIGPNAWALAIDSGSRRLYWTDYVARKIQRASFVTDTGQLVAGSVEDVLTEDDGLEAPAGIALDLTGGRLYYADHGVGKIRTAKLDGSGAEDLVVNLSYPQGIAIDTRRGHVYFTDSGTFRVQRASLSDGTGLIDVVARGGVCSTKTECNGTNEDPYAVAVDVAESKLYWASVETIQRSPFLETKGKILRANLDGSRLEELFSVRRHKAFAITLASPQDSLRTDL